MTLRPLRGAGHVELRAPDPPLGSQIPGGLTGRPGMCYRAGRIGKPLA